MGCHSSWCSQRLNTRHTSVPNFHKRYCIRHFMWYSSFADDIRLSVIVDRPDNAEARLQADIKVISEWLQRWMVQFNPSKSEHLIVYRQQSKANHPPLLKFNEIIPEVDDHKYLGVFFSSDDLWHSQINYLIAKAWKRVHIMRQLMYILTGNHYKLFILRL